MKFGSVENLEEIDFKIPHEIHTNTSLTPIESNQKINIHIGCTGWSMPKWKGKLYPTNAKPSDFLQYYSRQFGTVEFNSSFYAIPKVTQVKKWKKDSAKDFKFCPKVNRVISQSRDLGTSNTSLDRFINAISHFEEKLGPCFLQLPEYFDSQKWPILDAFLRKWPQHVQLAIEFRHRSWFDPSYKEQLLQHFIHHRQSILTTDVAGFRAGVHQLYSTDYAVVRWVGNDLHPTDYVRLKAWCDIFLILRTKGLKDIFFLIHEPDNVLAPKISTYLYDLLLAIDNIEVKAINISYQDPLKLF